MGYLSAFVIGSSYPVFVTFFFAVSYIVKKKNYNYNQYSLIAPLYLGVMNMLGLYLSKRCGWSHNQRFLLTGILSGLIVATFSTVTRAYNFTSSEWLRYYVVVITHHVFAFAVVINLLTKLISLENCR